MHSQLQRFRTYEIAQDPGGGSLELGRTEREVVCLASLPQEQRWVELHVLAGVDTTEAASRPTVDGFYTQIQALKRLRDRRVLEILEAGEDEGALFYVSEFVDGETLDVYLARCTPLPPWWAVEVARQLTLGLLALRSAPAVLARTQVFNARLTLEGETPADTLVKLADFDLGGAPPSSAPSLAAAEAQAVHEVGRLLGYAATGLITTDASTPRALATPPLPGDLSSLLDQVLSRRGRSSPSDLAGLFAALTAAALSPSLAAAPPRLPPALRPRLPLAAHFPTLPRLATETGQRLRLERAVFDAAQPYAQRGFDGTTAVTVQLTPPARLLSPAYLAPLRRAADRGSVRPSPHLLRVLEVPAHDDAGWFLEEGAPRLTLHRVRHLRRHLTPAEAAFLLREHDRAVLALESRGLEPVAVAPQEIFLDFSGTPGPAPGDDELSSRPVHAWPPFKIKLRAHPTAVHLAQPRRFLRDRLLDPSPPRPATDAPPGPPAGLGSPSAADYAALFAWLCGGVTAVPAALAAVVQQALESAQGTRASIVDAVIPFIPRPEKPGTAKPKAAPPKKTPANPAKPSAKSRRAPTPVVPNGSFPNSGGRSSPPPAAASPARSRQGAHAPVEEPIGFFPLAPPREAEREDTASDGADEPGFAEMLLGASLPRPFEPPPSFGAPASPLSGDDTEPLPVGALFGTGVEDPEDDEAPISPRSTRKLDFSTGSSPPSATPQWRLILLMVGIALAIAAVMAHFTGLGFWR